QTSYTDKKLKGNTTYCYKVRAYAEVNGVTYYGDYSAATKTKTKKSDSQKVVAKAKAKIGARYRSGGSGPKSFDCSGFVYWVYKNADVDAKKKVKRTSSAGLYSSLKKYKVGSSIKSIKKEKAGDIILFNMGVR
ncbi:NlpC/P60 family protein, partial [Eubacteriales bacterium DFI.9.88]|nr:NlpC/P60 family protein [Eubacteriales bacterium DFI.9.88]